MMQAGDLVHKLLIQQNTSDTDVPVWVDVCTVYGSRKALSGTAYVEALVTKSDNDMLFTVRYGAATLGIRPGMRIIEDGELIFPPFVVTTEPVEPSTAPERRRWLTFHARREWQNGS